MKFKFYKYRAGSLQFATLLGVVVALIVGAFILLTYTRLQFAKKIERSTSVVQWANDAIAIACQEKNFPYGDTLTIEAPDFSRTTYQIHQSHWGIYDKLSSKAQLGVTTHHKMALIGGALSSDERPALYLQDTRTPLVVVGNTKIYGNVKLPKQGVKAGNIAGNYFRGDKLIYGYQGMSKPNLPQVSFIKRQYIEQLLGPIRNVADSSYISLGSGDKFEQTFSGIPKWHYKRGPIFLGDVDLKGNIIIKSDSLIRISAFAKVENIILVAPHIEIAAKFKGRLQAVASKTIDIGVKAQLQYPSALIVYKDNDSISPLSKRELEGIVINEGAHITGSVVYLGESKKRQFQPNIQMKAGSEVYGEIFCERSFELKGRVYGSVFAKSFAAKERGSVYQNHIFNGHIDSRNFSEKFAGIQTILTGKDVVQWLD